MYLQSFFIYGKINIRDILFLVRRLILWTRDQKEEDRMNKYELAVIVNAALEEEERANTIEKVKEYVTRFGGTVTNVDEWGKKRLAYEIQKMKEAYYYFIQFESENSNCPNEVEENIRIMENVVRFLCVRKEA